MLYFSKQYSISSPTYTLPTSNPCSMCSSSGISYSTNHVLLLNATVHDVVHNWFSPKSTRCCNDVNRALQETEHPLNVLPPFFLIRGVVILALFWIKYRVMEAWILRVDINTHIVWNYSWDALYLISARKRVSRFIYLRRKRWHVENCQIFVVPYNTDEWIPYVEYNFYYRIHCTGR